MDESETTERERKYYKSWQDRLDKGKTFKDFSLFRPKILTMWNTSSYASGPGLEAGVDKDTLEVSNDSTSQPSTKTAHPRKLRKRVILAIAFGIGAIVAALVPVVLIFYLPKAEPSEVVSTVELQATVQNKKFTEALDNKNSLEYRNFTSEFCSEVEAVFQTSDLKDTYDGCLVTDLRNGSIIVIFQVVFIAKVIPTEIQIKSSLLSSTKETTDTGQILVSFGVFLLAESTVIVGTVTIIEAADNPVPKIAYGNSCRVTSSCKTDWAECSGQRCTCPSSRYISHQSDSCFMLGSILGGKCSATCSVSHAECDDSQDPVCVCSPGYYNKDETCESKIAFEDPCVEAGPTDQCATFGAGCTNNKCSCNETHFYYQQNDTCLQLGSILGEACSGECDDPNSVCEQDKESRCICDVGYYDRDGTCEEKIPFEDPCVETGPTDQCKSHGAGCNNNKCNCEETHFHYSKNDTCLQLGSILGEACSDGCDIAYAVCDQDQESICICDVGYYKKDGTCEQTTTPETSPTTTTRTQATSSSSKSTSTTQISSTAKLTESTSPLPSEIMSKTTPPPSSLVTTTATSSSLASFTTVMTSTSLETQTAILTTNKMAPTSTLMMTTPTSSAGTITSTMTETIRTVPSSERLPTSSSLTLRTTSASSTKMTKTVPATTLETQTTSTSKTMAISSTASTSQTTTIKSDPSLSVTASNSQTSPQSTTSLTSAAKTVLTSLLKSTMSISVSTPTTISTPTSSEKSSPTSPTTITIPTVTTPIVTKKPSSVSLPLTTTVMETSTLSTGNKIATSPTETTTQTSSTVMPPSTTSTMTASQTSPATATKPTVSTTATPTHMSTGEVTSTSLASPVTTMTTPPTTTPTRPHSLETTVSIAVSTPATMSSPTSSRRVMTPTLLTTDKISTSSSKETTSSLSSTTAPPSSTSISTKTESTPLTTLTSSTTSSTPSSFTSVAASISSTTQLISSTKALTPSSTTSKSSLTSSTHIIVPTVTAPTVTTKLSSMSLPLKMTTMKASTSSTVNKAATTPTEMTTHISSTVMPPSTTSTMTSSQTTSATAMKLTVSTTATPTTMSARTLTSITLTTPISTMTTPPTTTQNSPHSPTSGIPPNINLFVPGSKKLEIGKEETIACAIYNIEHVATAKLERTVGEVTELICSLSKSDTEFDLSYGDGKNSHMSVDVLMLNSDKGANITLSFDPVQCSDSATYRCSVIARDESVDTEAKSEHVDVYKPPLLELNFPFEFREGTYGINVGCRASLGYPRGDLIMQRKLPGESIFTLYEPVVQKEAELRWIESNDTTNICITDVRYDFDTPLEGWNMTEFRCAINVGTETEMYSDVGVFEIVPKSVCSGKGVGENVQHPFNCKLYATCNVDTTTSSELIWSYVKESSCSGDECWLPTGQCGTTQSPTTTTSTTTTTTTLPPGVPHIKCVLRSPLAKVGDSLHYSCNLQYVDKITRFDIPELNFQEESNAGISGFFTVNTGVSLNVSMPDGYEIGISFENVRCNQEGNVTIIINNEASDTISVRIISDAEVPTLSMPEDIFKNQKMTISCSGIVGRQEDGSPVATLMFQVKFNNTSEFSTYTEGTKISSVSSDSCTNLETKLKTFYPNDQWSGAEVRCVTIDDTNEVNNPTEPVGPLNLLEPDIYFDAASYVAVIGQMTSFTCFVNNIPNEESITVTRGSSRQPVIIILKPSGAVEKHHLNFDAVYDVNTSGLHAIRITFTPKCGDAAKYFCESSGMSTATDIYVLSKPQLTLSYEIVQGQDPWEDRPSWCEGDLGGIEGSFVVEVFSSGLFVEYTDWWEKDLSSTETDCGIYKKQNFVFYENTLEFLKNKQIRCAVKTAETFTEQELPVSEAKTIRVTPSSYCDNNNWKFYEHPYDCGYYVDCNTWHTGNIHFQPCNTGLCPNRTACVKSSCDELCNRQFTIPTTTIPTTRGIDPYIDCNNTVKGEVGSDLTIYCVIGNTDDNYLTNITIYKGQSLFLEASGDHGTEETTDQTASVTYTPTTIGFTVFKLGCAQSTIYRFVVNNLLEDSVTVIANKEPAEPVLILPSLIRNQRATVTCKGNLGYPEGLWDIHLEKKMAGDTSFTEITEGITYTPSKFNESECAFIKTLNFAFYATDDWIDGTIKCVTVKETEVLYSQSVTITVLDKQEVSFNPDQPTGEVGEPLSINCMVTGVSGLNAIRIYHGDEPQSICNITDAGVTNIDNIACSGELNSNEGSIQIDFSSVQCGDEGEYICEPNNEASTPTSTFLTVTRAPTSPTMISEPKTLVEDKLMLNEEKFVCEATVGYPRAGSIILQTNRGNGNFEKLLEGNSEIQPATDNCGTNKTLTVKGLTFDAAWNNTQVRCAVEDDEGIIIETDSKTFTIQLLPENYCGNHKGYSIHPLHCHNYIWCVGGTLYVFPCHQDCPVFNNETSSYYCGVCSTCP